LIPAVPDWGIAAIGVITPAMKHLKYQSLPRIKSGAGFDPASGSILASRGSLPSQKQGRE
jgi:hypothetical protein